MGKKKSDLLDDETYTGTIESKIQLEQLTLKNKRWEAKLIVNTILPRSYHRYTIELSLDEKPYLERIEAIEKDLRSSLFAEEKVSKKKSIETINGIQKELDSMRKQCEEIKFGAVVQEIKYKDGETVVICRIPDDVIEPLNRQKYKMDAYRILLTPIYTE